MISTQHLLIIYHVCLRLSQAGVWHGVDGCAHIWHILYFDFCTVGGSGDKSSIFIYSLWSTLKTVFLKIFTLEGVFKKVT